MSGTTTGVVTGTSAGVVTGRSHVGKEVSETVTRRRVTSLP